MARKPDAPCTICGKPTWSGRGCMPPDLRICRPCRSSRFVPHGTAMNLDCVVCGSVFEWVKVTNAIRTTCSQACLTLGRQRPCLDCEAPIHSGGGRLRCPPCAERRKAEQHAEKCRRRRVLKRGGKAEPYTLAEIAQRDRHRCQLCRRKVNMTIKWPDPKSPSIDHVIPVTEGGDDTKANVQLAHFGCNSSKGVGGSQQLALVG